MSGQKYSYECEVGFADTDASGWVHFSKTLVFVERAEHELLKQLGIPCFGKEGAWPRVHVQVDYRQPLQFGDRMRVELALAKLGSTSLKWIFSIYKDESELAAEGEMVTVRLDASGKPTAIADGDQEKLQAYLKS